MNKNKALSALSVALQYLPFVLAGVSAIQTSHSSLPGATRKTILLSAVEAATKVGEQVPESHVAIVSALIDAVVSSLKTGGADGFTPVQSTTAS